MSQFRSASTGWVSAARRIHPALALSCLAAVVAAPMAHAADQPPPSGAAIGDFNGDGFGDFVPSLSFPANRQEAQILFGSATPGPAALLGDGGPGVRVDLSGAQSDPARANPVAFLKPARIGDFDRDGYDDVFIDGTAGSSWVIYGGTSTSQIRAAAGESRVTQLLDDSTTALNPVSSYGIGDFDGDGFTDVLHPRAVPTSSSTAAFGGGNAVISGGGPRVAQLDSTGTGARRVQVNGKVSCITKYLFFLKSYECNSVLEPLRPIGDLTGDGKADLYQPNGSFVIPGRAGATAISGFAKDASSISVPLQPAGDPWTPKADPAPTPDPSQAGTDGWTTSGVAARQLDGSVNLAAKDYANVAGAIYDARKTIDARDVQVDADLTLVAPAGVTPGNGATVAFASRSEGGSPTIGNPGLGLGWVTNKGVAIALGTVKGGLTPSSNYVAIANGVVGKSGYPTLLQSAPAVTPLANNTTHVTVRSVGGVVSVSLNGIERLRRTMAMPSDAYLGFTAGESTARQDHIVKNVVVTKP